MSTGSVSEPEDAVAGSAGDAAGACTEPRRDALRECEGDALGHAHGSAGSAGGRRGRARDGRQTQRRAANARERARMRVLSSAFCRLKTSLPWVPADTKLSKLDTLRLAASYISHLRHLLQHEPHDSPERPAKLTWPFVVSGRPEDSSELSTAGRLCGATA